MQTTEGSITTHTDDQTVTDVLLTYSEEERQVNEINAVNAEAVFSPRFILIDTAIQRTYSLTDTEAKLYGFICFYMNGGARRFYFTNEQLAQVLYCSEASVKRAVKTLGDKELCTFSYKIKANGGKIRFVDKVPDLFRAPTGQFDQSDGSKRPEKDNKLKGKLLTKVSKAKADGSQETYGQEQINLILSRFKQHIGVIPADRRPRHVAQNIRQIINRFIRDHHTAYTTVRGGELTFEYLLDKAWEHLLAKDYGNQIEKLETFKLKTRVYLDGASQALLKAYETKRHQETAGEHQP